MTIFFNKKEKRKLQTVFRSLKVQKVFFYLTFAALIALLIQELKPKHGITIDREYPGHEDFIKEKVTLYLQQMMVSRVPRIQFGHVGTLSNAHQCAYKAAIGKSKPTVRVNAKEVAEVIFGIEKIGIA